MKLSVYVATYNQERFIRQAIQSVLMQKTNFDYELVIGEDCSQDKTCEIVASFASKYPRKVRALFANKNLGAARNFARAYQACRGEYVAGLDGDDYWTSPDKLQKQVDFLDAHPECSACFHAMDEILEVPNRCADILSPPGKKRFYTLSDYANGIIATQSAAMFRNRIVGELPDWYFDVAAGDWVLQVLLAERGPIGYLDEVMGIHRIQPRGAWYEYRSNDRVRFEAAIRVQQSLVSHLEQPYKALFKRHLYKLYYNLAHELCNYRDFHGAREYAQICVKEWGYDVRISPFEPMRIYAHIYAGPLYRLLRAAKRKLLGHAPGTATGLVP